MQSRLRAAGRLVFVVGCVVAIVTSLIGVRKTEMMKASFAEWSAAYDQHTRAGGGLGEDQAARDAELRMRQVYAVRATDLDEYFQLQSLVLLAAYVSLAATGMWMIRASKRYSVAPPSAEPEVAAALDRQGR